MEELVECPDAERLSTFLNGRLFGKERDKLLLHLRHCKECYDVFTLAANIQNDLPDSVREMEPAYRKAKSLTSDPHGWRYFIGRKIKRKAYWPAVSLPVAAAILVVVLLPQQQNWASREILENVISQKEISILNQSLSQKESDPAALGFIESISNEKAVFKSGIILAKLEIALLAKDQLKGKILSEQLVENLEVYSKTGVPNKELSDFLTHLNNHKTNLAEIETILPKIESQLLDSPQEFYLKLGLTVEIGQIYTRLKKPEFIQKSYLDYILTHPKLDTLPPGVISRLHSIKDLQDKKSIAENHEMVYKLLQNIESALQ